MEYSYRNSFLPKDPIALMKYIGCENIFKLIFTEISLDKKYTSPLREEDTHSGCFFWEAPESGLLIFVDFGNVEKTHLDPIAFLQKYYKLDTYGEAIDLVRDKFKSSTNIDRVVTIEDNNTKVIRKEIKVFPRNWSKRDRLFWEPYGISKQQLIDDKVVPVEYFQIFRGENFKTLRPYQNSYAYSFTDGTKKIYTPYNLQFKWVTTTSKDTIGNLENIDQTGEDLIITKSYKDCRVLRNLGHKNVIWFQSESQIPNINLILDTVRGYKRVLVLFDNDEVGTLHSNKLVSFMNGILNENKFYSIEIPKEYKDTKDTSDFYKKYGEEQTNKLINKIIKNVRKKN